MSSIFRQLIKLLIIPIFTYIPFHLHGQEIVKITDFGVNPGDTINITPVLRKALQASAGKENSIIVFPNGDYHFYPESSNKIGVGLFLNGINNLTIDGDGSMFIFHGEMQIVSIFNCNELVLKNFKVDWDKPLTCQGMVIEVQSDYIDIGIENDQYPYLIEDSIFYLNPGGKRIKPRGNHVNLYDKMTGELLKESDDKNFKDFLSNNAAEIKPGVVRFFKDDSFEPVPGTILTFSASDYIATGISIIESKRIKLKDITIHYALGDGIAAARSEDISLENVDVLANKKKDRVFSSIGNASHFISCSGKVVVSECTHTGAGGYFMKLHGEYIPVDTILNRNFVISSRFRDLKPEDEIWFVSKDNYQRIGSGIIRQKQPIIRNNRISLAGFLFKDGLPEYLQQGDLLESKKWSPEVRINNCTLTKSNRSGGIMINTPGKILIEDNYFSTTGSAIILDGNLDSLYESGACNDVVIRNNIFENCLPYQCNIQEDDNWGKGVISISPKLTVNQSDSLPYHKNLLIIRNNFRLDCSPLLYANLAGTITFTENEIQPGINYSRRSAKIPFLSFNSCRNISIIDNLIDRKYRQKKVEIINMDPSDLSVEGFEILKN